MPTDHFDLLVIGAGPAGLAAALAAGIFGRKVALIERKPEIGGALINTGTLPSKTLRETALALSGFRSRELYGVDLSLRRTARVADFLHHERDVKVAAQSNVEERLARFPITRIEGSARFVSPRVIEVTPPRDTHDARAARAKDGANAARAANAASAATTPNPRRLRAKFILIATGSTPNHPPEFVFEHPRIWDSDEILQLEQLPKTLAVIGAGVIGAEYASTFQALGAQVHLIDGRDELLPFLDEELSRRLEETMTSLGIRFHWKERVKSCRAPERGAIKLVLTSGKRLAVDAVLVAAGRRATVDGLQLDKAGLTLNERGHLDVDAKYRTKVPHIYAAGDVIGFPSLASVSAEQARVAVCDAFCVDLKEGIDPVFPSGIYTIPEASGLGETEEALREKGVDYVVGRAEYRDNARGAIIGDSSGFLKLLFRRKDLKLLGAHAMGEQATELIHVAMITMLHGGGASDFERACFNVPTLSNLYKEAAYRAQISRDLPAVERQIARRMARRAAHGVARPIQQPGARAIGRPASKRA